MELPVWAEAVPQPAWKALAEPPAWPELRVWAQVELPRVLEQRKESRVWAKAEPQVLAVLPLAPVIFEFWI